MSEILYRKWRPRSFAELAGQEHVTTTLQNALASGRVAHAYLFAGPRGTGKTSTARLLAKALNCPNRQGGEPCNACESCRAFDAGSAWELIEKDAASNRGIDDIRDLRDKVANAAGSGPYKVYLIDEVHMLTDAAFNALLKTLEEPPPHVVFILATTEAHKLPPTITSRCQRFDFHRIPLSAAVTTLERICQGEGIACETEALELIARSATGSLRDAENLLDQLATSYGKELTVEHVRAGLGLIGDERAGELARLTLNGDLAGGLSLIASVRDDGLDLRQFQRELVDGLRDLLMAKSGLPPSEGASEERRRELQATVAGVPTPRLLAALRAYGEADLKPDPNSTLPLDIALAECVLASGVGEAGPVGRTPPSDQSMAPSGNRAIGQAPAVASTPPVAQSPAATPPSPRAEPAPSAHPEPVEGPDATEPIAAPIPTPRVAEVAPYVSSQPQSGDITAVRQQMRAIYEKARALQFQVGALLNSVCDIIAADDASVTFGFRFPAQVSKISEPQNLKTLTEAVSSVLGRPVSVSCQHDANVSDWKQREVADRSPLVRAAQEMGARIISEDGAPPGGMT